MREQGTRLQSSVVTFGPGGRVVATVLVLLPVAWFAFAGPWGVAGLAIWVFVLLPRALRDVWRRAELPVTDLTRAGAELRLEAELHEKLVNPPARDATPPPTRW